MVVKINLEQYLTSFWKQQFSFLRKIQLKQNNHNKVIFNFFLKGKLMELNFCSMGTKILIIYISFCYIGVNETLNLV